jgi:hypothetical protein
MTVRQSDAFSGLAWETFDENTRSPGGQVIGPFELLLTEEYPDSGEARKRKNSLKSGQGRHWLDGLVHRTGPGGGG